MNLFTRSDRAARAAAVLAAIGFAGIAVLRVALAAGAPCFRPPRRVDLAGAET